jgi:hypothetical protein
MEDNHITILQNKIEEALKIAAIKLIETKRKNKQKIVISENGEIKIITP